MSSPEKTAGADAEDCQPRAFDTDLGPRRGRGGGQAGQSRLRVLHALLSLECGGMEHIVVDLVRCGVEAGQRVEVLCLERPGELASRLSEWGIPVHCLEKRPGIQLRLRGAILRLLRAARPDVIHTHQIGTLFYVGPAARRAGISAIVHTEHGSEYNGRWKTRWLARLAARHAERFFCVSDDTVQHVLGHRVVAKCKVDVIHNGIDVDLFESACSEREPIRRDLAIPSAALVIGTVGRLSEIKRQDLLVRAFAGVLKRIPDAHLLLVGDGPKREDLLALSTALGLGEQVHFAGYRADRQRCLAAMDLFALSSDSEGTPLALLEAWATHLPVVATAVGGLPELVEDGKTGVLVPPGDPKSLTEAFTHLLSDETLRTALAEAGHATVRARFTLRAMADRYAQEYRTLLSRTRPSRCPLSV
ncbi:MAG: glycosyltransferase [Pirellulales bacterium]